MGWELKYSSNQQNIEGLFEKMTFELRKTQSCKDWGEEILGRNNKDKQFGMKISMLCE